MGGGEMGGSEGGMERLERERGCGEMGERERRGWKDGRERDGAERDRGS